MKGIRLGNINVGPENKSNSVAPKDRMARLPKSMADLTTQILALAVNGAQGILIIVMNGIEPVDLNKYQYRWIVYTVQIISIAAFSVFVHAIYFVRNVSITKAIWRQITGNA